MELPPYHLPTLKATLTHMFERGIMYLKKKQITHPCCFHPRMVHHNISMDVKYSRLYDALHMIK